MKVLFVIVKIDFARFIPLGVAFLAAYIQERGHKVSVYDETPGERNDLDLSIQEFNPDMIVVSCMTATYNQACKIIEKIKIEYPLMTIVFGGSHVTSVPKEVLENNFIDFVVMGEGELTFVELIKTLEAKENNFDKILGLAYKKNGEIKINEKRLWMNVENNPLPARHLFNMRFYSEKWNWPRGYWLKTANMMSSRGCAYNCVFCASKNTMGKTLRADPVEKVLREVELLVDKYEFECISFSDDIFAVDKKRAIEIVKGIKALNKSIVYRIQLRVDTVSEELIKVFASTGCIHIDFGVESGSQRILNVLKKGITISQIKKAFKLCRKYGITTGSTFILGSPTETEKDVEMSRQLAKSIKADYTQFFILMPYIGTPLYEESKKKGLFIRDVDYDDFRHGGFDLKPLLKTVIPPKRLIELRDKLNAEFVDKSVIKYLDNEVFVKDLAQLFIDSPSEFKKYSEVLLKTKNIGEALKSVMPHKL